MHVHPEILQGEAISESLLMKASYYESLHLYEAEKYVNNLALNIELALTTMPSDEDTKIP